MKIENKDIQKVLALFDKEDIPYINFKYIINNYISENNQKNSSHVKVKKMGGRNDRSRK